MPHTEWLGFEGANTTYSGLVLGVFGLALLYLSLTGLWLWFPRPSRWRSSMSVRWSKGRFARDTDLHKVAGMIALPLLLVWGVTGAGFEFQPVGDAWYAVTRATPNADSDVESAPGTGDDIPMSRAIAAAAAMHPDYPVVAVDAPAAEEENATYTVWLASGLDPYANTDYPGDVGVAVDRRTAEATIFYGADDEPLAQRIWDSWNYPVHSGYVVNGWWRLAWLALGLSPIVLAVTGVSTWLVRHRSRRNRARLGRSGGGSGTGLAADGVAGQAVG